MKNNLLNEEIKKFLLLTNYRPSKTLSENEVEIDELRGAGRTAIQKLDLQKAGQNLAKLGGLDAITKVFKLVGAETDNLVRALTRSSDEMESALVSAIQKDFADGVRGPQLGPAAKNVSKEIAMALTADDLSKTMVDFTTSVPSKKGGLSTPKTIKMTLEKLISDSVNYKGQKKADADALIATETNKLFEKNKEIAKNFSNAKKLELEPSGKLSTQKPGPTRPGGSDVPRDGGGGWASNGVEVSSSGNRVDVKVDVDTNQIMQFVQQNYGTKSNFNRFWTSGKMTWGNVWPYLAAAGTGAALYGLVSWLFSKNGAQYFPQCIGGKVMLNPQGLEKTAKEGLPTNMVYMMDPANPKLNGALFISDGKNSKTGKVKLQDGKSGSYIHTGDKVEIKAGNDVIYMDCSQTLVIQGGDNQETTPKPKPSGGCTPSSNFPFEYYQRNSMVGQVQNCVGASVDNCMGPQTAGKIQQFLGLSETPSSLTKDIYDKVMTKCKGSTSTKQEPIKEPTQTSGGVTGGGEKPSSEEDFEY